MDRSRRETVSLTLQAERRGQRLGNSSCSKAANNLCTGRVMTRIEQESLRFISGIQRITFNLMNFMNLMN